VEDSEELEVPIGIILAGKYRVERVLGAGGMGIVVAAHHLQLDQPVAIKMLLPSMLKHREAVERFSREARAAVKIKSEHVARVSDVGTLETGAPYMVMEYLDGEDLGRWVADHGALEISQAVEFVLQAAEAIAEAHALGIVHRDIKPSNLFCVRRADGLLSVKVLDFGISKLANAPSDLGMTKTQTVMGSPHYMAPEQVLSAKNADAQSDIWSLGAVLFELLAGHVPFEAETFPELVLKVSGTDAPSIDRLRDDVPAELALVVGRMLQRDRDLRYRNLAEVAVDLVPFGPERRAEASAERIIRVLEAGALSVGSDGLPSGLPTLPVGSRRPFLTATTKVGPMTPAANRTVAAFTHTADETKARSRRGLGVIALGVALVVGAGLWIFQSRSATEEPAADQTAIAPASVDGGAQAAIAKASAPLPVAPPAEVTSPVAPAVEPAAKPEPVQPANPPAEASTPTKKPALRAKTSSPKPAPASTPPAAQQPAQNSDPNSAFGGRL
jgi:serine/threonine protein kinase